jgi:uncharacterized protein HemX
MGICSPYSADQGSSTRSPFTNTAPCSSTVTASHPFPTLAVDVGEGVTDGAGGGLAVGSGTVALAVALVVALGLGEAVAVADAVADAGAVVVGQGDAVTGADDG